MTVQPGLCRTWSETPKTGFLRTRLILKCYGPARQNSVVLFSALNNDWWIGLSDIDGDFQWEVNTIGLPYTNWLPGKVDIQNTSECSSTLMIYILGKIIKTSPNGHFHIWYIWSDLWRKSGKILKNGFLVSRKRGQNEVFPI